MRIGVDLARVGELDGLLPRPWFRRYFFTADELRQAGDLAAPRAAEFLTGRFAAKEAVLKVLGRGLFEGVSPRDIEVVRQDSGEPGVRLSGGARDAAERVGVTSLTVSIAHKGADVVAVAIGAAR
ncbi:holo-ACP synthase [Saccharothrix xinjiangensis]|uniref:Holo-[acyl-carrier-protein] synthase n=1 Tax=Saccharothrix xinjiangensis TaxID=204798 RepID=A0ABV9Y384_9PSEU